MYGGRTLGKSIAMALMAEEAKQIKESVTGKVEIYFADESGEIREHMRQNELLIIFDEVRYENIKNMVESANIALKPTDPRQNYLNLVTGYGNKTRGKR